MQYFVYIVRCRDGAFYTGIAWNLTKRIKEHNLRTRSCLQKSKVPVELAYWERFDSKEEAAKREKEIKGWRREKKEYLIKEFTLKPRSG